jgi:hypothetical protein
LLEPTARHTRAEPRVGMRAVGYIKDRRPPGEMIPRAVLRPPKKRA